MSYCVANYKGELIAHDLKDKLKAKLICEQMQHKEPDEEWEVIEQ